ncbi:MAG: hypothetical protein ACOC80_16330 [Petrotogales bacterium]
MSVDGIMEQSVLNDELKQLLYDAYLQGWNDAEDLAYPEVGPFFGPENPDDGFKKFLESNIKQQCQCGESFTGYGEACPDCLSKCNCKWSLGVSPNLKCPLHGTKKDS